ncbi:unnamed protein product [Amoebophrya sp. A120]|nr:unnamed protein product [Amoebophrya sp. A120]|eukprot:GSA120T00001392001.1
MKKLAGMESSQIALIDVNLSKRNFVTWNVNRPVSVGVNLQVMRDMLKSGQSDDFWRMYQYPDDEYIHMQIFSRRNSMAKLDFQWKSMDIDMENIEAPSELCAGEPSVVMASWRFKELMSEFKAMGDNLEVCLNPSHLTWHVTEPGKRVIDYWHDSRQDPEGSRVMISLGENDELRGWKKTFGLKHLDIFSRGSSLAGKIKIWLFHQHPACYHYDIEDDPTLGWARFWLAPFADSNVGGGNEGGG